MVSAAVRMMMVSAVVMKKKAGMMMVSAVMVMKEKGQKRGEREGQQG